MGGQNRERVIPHYRGGAQAPTIKKAPAIEFADSDGESSEDKEESDGSDSE